MSHLPPKGSGPDRPHFIAVATDGYTPLAVCTEGYVWRYGEWTVNGRCQRRWTCLDGPYGPPPAPPPTPEELAMAEVEKAISG